VNNRSPSGAGPTIQLKGREESCHYNQPWAAQQILMVLSTTV